MSNSGDKMQTMPILESGEHVMTRYQGFAGTYTGHGSRGVYSFRFENGILSDPELFCEIASPKYLALENGRLAALADFEQGSGAVLLDAEGKVLSKLAYENKTSCYLAWHGGDLYSANYHEGTVSRLKVQDGTLELQKKVLIKDGAGCHMVLFWKDEILVPSLFLDEIRIFDPELNPAGSISMPAGSGPRHGVFSADGTWLYLVSELSNELFVIRMADHAVLASIPVLADGLTHVKDTAAVRLSRDGRRLYVSTRTQDVLSVINIEDPLHPSLLQCVSSDGQHPRDFILQDHWLIAANRFSNSIVSFALEDGLIGPETSRIEIPEAVALVMEEEL